MKRHGLYWLGGVCGTWLGLQLVGPLAPVSAQGSTPEPPVSVSSESTEAGRENSSASVATPAASPASASTVPAAAASQADASSVETPADAPPADALPAAAAIAEMGAGPAPEAVAPAAALAKAGPIVCVLGQHGYIPRPDAMTAASMMCEALRAAGANVATEPVRQDQVSGGERYRVDLRPLGKVTVLQVSFESQDGKASSSSSMRLAGIEEVPVAAPRLADALLHGKPLPASATVDSLVGEETRRYEKRYGETLLGVGVLGFGVPNTDIVTGYGAYGRLHYETPRYSIGADARIGGSVEEQGDGHLAGLSVGGRLFFSEGAIGPFVGGGLGILWLGAYEDRASDEDAWPDRVELDGNGLAPYAELGIEFLRLHESRLEVLVRVDVPLFEMEGNDLDGSDKSRYGLPIALMAAYSFN